MLVGVPVGLGGVEEGVALGDAVQGRRVQGEVDQGVVAGQVVQHGVTHEGVVAGCLLHSVSAPGCEGEEVLGEALLQNRRLV